MKYFFHFILICTLFSWNGKGIAKESTLLVVSPSFISDPIVLYLDIISGPTSGGENNKGVYLTVFGRHLYEASDVLGTDVKILIGTAEVDNYRLKGSSKADDNIQSIVCQIGNLGNQTAGVALPVKVIRNGISSNTNITFTIQPGNIYFIDFDNGDDATGVANDINNPFKNIQANYNYNTAAFASAQAGDVFVYRGAVYDTLHGHGFGTVTGNVSGIMHPQYHAVRFVIRSGTAPTGIVGDGYFTITSYPGESVIIHVDSTSSGGFVGPPDNGSGWGKYVQIANLVIHSHSEEQGAAPINLQVAADYWRIVNNELTWQEAVAAPFSKEARGGGVVGNGDHVEIVGNYIHNIGGGTLNHGIYLDDGMDYNIGYNHIDNCFGGNLFQTFNTSGEDMTDVKIHHNRLHEGTRYGLNLGSGLKSGDIYNNLVYSTDYATARFALGTSIDIDLHHNTFYDGARGYLGNNTGTVGLKGMLNFSSVHTGDIDVHDNIWYATNDLSSYINFIAAPANVQGVLIDNNVWFGAPSQSPPSQDANFVTGNPLISNLAGEDFSIQIGSACIDESSIENVSDDFIQTARPVGGSSDVGAYEYDASIFPLDLIKFDGKADGLGHVKLTWTSVFESNTAFFDIQRSYLGKHFESIGKVEALGYSKEQHAYKYLDKPPVLVDNYYRLQVFDWDENTQFSKIILVSLNKKSDIFKVFPNPATDFIDIELLDASTENSIKITDFSGKTVWSEQVIGTKKRIAVNYLPKGLYFISLSKAKGMEVKKICIQK